jgi:hypothetical protein
MKEAKANQVPEAKARRKFNAAFKREAETGGACGALNPIYYQQA